MTTTPEPRRPFTPASEEVEALLAAAVEEPVPEGFSDEPRADD